MKISRFFLSCFTLAFLMCGADAHAAPDPLPSARDLLKSYKACAVINDRASRLRCYDNIGRDLNVITVEEQKKQDDVIGRYGFWQVIESKDAFSRGQIFLKLESTNGVPSNGIETHPLLTIACFSGKTDVYVDWQHALSVDDASHAIPVQFSIDDADPLQDKWTLSQDNAALYASDSSAMIRTLRGHKTLAVLMSPEGTPQTLRYDLDGMDSALQILIQRCYRGNGQPQ